MLDFSDKPYRYFPPRRFAPVVWLLGHFNRRHFLPKTKQIVSIDVTGQEALLSARQPGDRVLIVPNHPSHSDAEVLFEALRRIGITTQTMAAYDVFLRSLINRWILQRSGVFSVDREGSDPKAMAEARRTLMDGRHALTIFPEGNVYLQNDQVTPFHEGAAMLGLRAAKDLAKDGTRVLAAPVSIKLTHVTDVRSSVLTRLSELEKAVEVSGAADDDVVHRLRRVGLAALHRNLRHRGIDPPHTPDADPDVLPGAIDAAAGLVLDRLEKKLELAAKPGESLIDRVRKARRAIHQVRIDPDRAHDYAAAATWADEAMLAFRIVSYTPTYVQQRTTLDRLAEMVEKLDEDLHRQWRAPFGPRHAYVHFGAPIDLGTYLESFGEKARVAVRQLTDDLESAVQAGVDRANEGNTHVGGSVDR